MVKGMKCILMYNIIRNLYLSHNVLIRSLMMIGIYDQNTYLNNLQ